MNMATTKEEKRRVGNDSVSSLSQRKSSFSNAFTNITTNPFNRRRTATILPELASSNAATRSSRIPTPSGIPPSTSFFGNSCTIATKPTLSHGDNESSGHSAPGRRSRKISERLAQAPFFYQHQRFSTTPLMNKQKRDSSVLIEQRGLMAPLHPPLPRSSTMGTLENGQQIQSSPHTPSFMRPTSSSAARGSSPNASKQRRDRKDLMPIISFKTSTRAPSSKHNLSDKTSTTPRDRPSDIRTSFDTPPPSPPNNTPVGKRSDSSSHGEEEADPDPNASIVHPTRKSSMTLAPIQSPGNSGLSQRRKPVPSLSATDLGDDGVRELRGLKGQHVKSVRGNAAGQSRNQNEDNAADGIVPAGRTEGEVLLFPAYLIYDQYEAIGNAAELSPARDHDYADDFVVPDVPRPLYDFSDPRLVSTFLMGVLPHTPIPPIRPDPQYKLSYFNGRFTRLSTMSNGPADSRLFPTVSAPIPYPLFCYRRLQAPRPLIPLPTPNPTSLCTMKNIATVRSTSIFIAYAPQRTPETAWQLSRLSWKSARRREQVAQREQRLRKSMDSSNR